MMMPMSLPEVAQAVSGRLEYPVAGGQRTHAEVDVVRSVVTDSRQVEPGALFVAVPGERSDGHDFVGRAAGLGACAALVSHLLPECALAQIVVDDTVKALGRLAAHNIERRRTLEAPFSVVGITGSVGKTTTKDLLAGMLTRLGPTVAPVGSFNNEIGLPLTALKVGPETRYLVAEMGASQVGDIAYLTSIVPPDIAVVLKVGVAHLGVFGSVERIAQAKSEIVQGLLPGGVSVLNADDERVAAMAQLSPGPVEWFGLSSSLRSGDGCSLDMTASHITSDAFGHPSFDLQARDEQPVPTRMSLSGTHNVMNALAAATVAHYLGLSTTAISQELAEHERISAHRMAVSQVERAGAHFTLIDDSFNANPDSMRAGLKALASWGAGGLGASKPYRIAVLGGMLELGEQTLDLHHSIGAYCAQLGLNALVAVGGEDAGLSAMAQAMVEGARAEYARLHAADSSQTETVLLAQGADQADKLVTELAGQHPGSVVLLKGSHFSGLSGVAQEWLGDRLGVVR
ncbi:UDP-N-acetylmuramoyl-tripeptide--D-alanyl-D-alanine ligase [Bombiscardovia nodaiensis]|uniref:UDP-N-acetylmuramoyl-tripeptide--D-alanyl-D-alanine ligase n=1 Tax=Bombiscardovia nodaiensis TaxID=2932181 RepID=A0ABN6SCL4_9BIFI|nr:UDP-N-acetylmuramoyl-tripeptide--D-alanyl-D-alanine ligase [Bombiscardovia nodaiensis]